MEEGIYLIEHFFIVSKDLSSLTNIKDTISPFQVSQFGKDQMTHVALSLLKYRSICTM